MQVTSLYLQCMNNLIQVLCKSKNQRPFYSVIKQLQQPGLVQVFTQRIIIKLIEWYPGYVNDDILSSLCNTRLHTLSLRGCVKVNLAGIESVFER